MKLQFSFEENGIQASLPAQLAWQVDQLVWALPGGARTARLQAVVKHPELIQPELFRNWLGKAVCVHHPKGEVWWHGWVSQIDLEVGRVRYRWNVDQVVSRVTARYPSVSTALDPYHAWAYSDWVEDDVLMDGLGAKEQIISLSFGDLSSAGQAAVQHLHRHNRISERTSILTQPAEVARIVLQASGWWQRLDWRMDQSEGGLIAHLPGGKSQQLFGLSGLARLSQSFLCNQADFALGQICLRMAIVGNPQDTVWVRLYSDASGQPGTLLAGSSLPAYQLQGGWQWLTWELDAPFPLNQGQRYWLVVERSGSLDSVNNYSLETDDGRGYADGALLSWNGSSWISLNEDVRFALLAVRETSQLIEEVGQKAVADEVLGGVQVWKESGLFLPRLRTPEKTRLERMLEWLQLGCEDKTPLSALVNASRTLEVFPIPRVASQPIQLDLQGRFNAPGCADMPVPLDLLGRLFYLPMQINRQPQVLSGLRWSPKTGLFPLIEL